MEDFNEMIADPNSAPLRIDRAWVVARVEEIRKIGLKDSEHAHAKEDTLHFNVLHAIAGGTCIDNSACASEAIKTREIVFERWYA